MIDRLGRKNPARDNLQRSAALPIIPIAQPSYLGLSSGRGCQDGFMLFAGLPIRIFKEEPGGLVKEKALGEG
jgi:hypothetical protein